MAKRMEENFEENDRERMTKNIDDLMETLKTIIDYMKSTLVGASHASTSNLYMVRNQATLNLFYFLIQIFYTLCGNR